MEKKGSPSGCDRTTKSKTQNPPPGGNEGSPAGTTIGGSTVVGDEAATGEDAGERSERMEVGRQSMSTGDKSPLISLFCFITFSFIIQNKIKYL